MNKGRSSAAGFTLIELVVVILIISILSAVAFSRYINIQVQARIAKATAIYGTIRTAANLAQAACILDVGGASVSPTCTATAGTVTMSGFSVDMVNEWPAATSSGIIAATQINPSADNLVISGTSPILIDIVGGTSPNCTISYDDAPAGGTPTITLNITGC